MFKEYKFKCTEVSKLLSSPREGNLPTEKQIEKALLALKKENYFSLTQSDLEALVIVINKYAEYSPSKVSQSIMGFLCEIYSEEIYGLSTPHKFLETTNRGFQVNGTLCEKIAIELLLRTDGVEYKKNKKMFQNDHFVGIPDILHGKSLKEIKIINNMPEFLYLKNVKADKEDENQLQFYMDVADMDTGELIYVLTGLHPDQMKKYAETARERYLSLGYESSKIDRMVTNDCKNYDFTFMPDSERIIRHSFKKNVTLIRFAKRKVTSCRNWLDKFHDKMTNKNGGTVTETEPDQQEDNV